MSNTGLGRLGALVGRIVAVVLLFAGVLFSIGILRLAWAFVGWAFRR